MAVISEFVKMILYLRKLSMGRVAMKIMIMTGRFGMGHYSVAQALKEDLEESNQGATVEVIDIMEYLLPRLNKLVYWTFNLLVSKCSGMYNTLNQTAERYNSIPFKGLIVRKIGKILEKFEPDLIISTLPISTKYVSVYKEETQCEIPLMTYITDICTHQEWIAKKSDYYFVGSKEVKTELVEKGVRADKICISGIPVRQCFQKEINKKQQKNIKEVLIMGGGYGLIPSAQKVFQALNQREDIHTTIITGTNKKLYEKLIKEYKNITVLGYTNKVDEYLSRADLLVSKAGGITLFEAVHCETPLFVIHPFLMQEISNANYIQEKNLGKVIWDKDADIVDELFSLLYDDEDLSIIRQNMKEFKEETIDSTIVKHIIASYAVA